MADTVPSIQIENSEERSKLDLQARTEQEAKVEGLLTKLISLQERLYQVRYDSSIQVSKKESDLRALAAEINRVHAKLLQEVYRATDIVEDQLQLHAVGLDNIFRDRTTEGKAFQRTKSSDGGFARSASTKGGIVQPPSSKGGIPKTPSTKLVGGTEPSVVETFLSFFKTDTENSLASRVPELAVIESDVAKIRATIKTLTDKKRLNEREQRYLQDLQEQLQLRVAQRDRISREELLLDTTTASSTTWDEKSTQLDGNDTYDDKA